MNILRCALLALSVASLSSCASPDPIGSAPGVEVAKLAALPAPHVNEGAIVRPHDSLQITVLGFEDLRRELTVDASGNFQFPLIGMVDADGRGPREISADISRRLRGDYVVNPEVIVDILEQPGRVFTVGGQVKKTGRYPILGTMSLLEAVATGGGTTDTAKLSEVLVFRTVEGQRYIGLYDLKAIQRGNYADPVIYPGDVIQVGDSPSLRRLQTITAFAPLIFTPLILIERTLGSK
ncbi:polysaccharide biosynthesis/export family protein [Qipengyuania sp. CAU 1752]